MYSTFGRVGAENTLSGSKKKRIFLKLKYNQLLHEIAAMAFLFVKIHLLVNNLSDILTLILVPPVV